MPKQTFFNLPDEKRQKIEQSALEEFAEQGFDKSNMNRIVAKSQIAKGSFYQYFVDKKDIYFHLIDTVITRKMSAMAPILGHFEEHGFTYNIEELFRLGLEFADSDPLLYRLGEDFATKKPEFVQEFMQIYTPVAEDIYSKLLETAQMQGELHDGIDISLARAFIYTLVNQATIRLIIQPKETRDYVISQLLMFIERAVLKNQTSSR